MLSITPDDLADALRARFECGHRLPWRGIARQSASAGSGTRSSVGHAAELLAASAFEATAALSWLDRRDGLAQAGGLLVGALRERLASPLAHPLAERCPRAPASHAA